MNHFFDLDLRDGIAHLRLNRPEHDNTMTPAFFPALRDAVRGLHDAGGTRVLVLSAAGASFCAGLAPDAFELPRGAEPARDRRDPHGESQRQAIGALMEMLDTPPACPRAGTAESLHRLIDCFDALEAARFPVICAVQGACSGAGLALASACDIRLASADAFFAVHEMQVGVAADLGVLQRLPRIVPQGVAREMAYAGEPLPAARALAVGLVNAVLADAQSLLEHAFALARRIAARSPLSVAVGKTVLHQARPGGSVPVADLLRQTFLDGDGADATVGWKAAAGSESEWLARAAKN